MNGQTLLERGVIRQLVQLLDSPERGLALNALWTFKNLLYKSTIDLKRDVTQALGWDTLQRYFAYVVLLVFLINIAQILAP